MKKIVAVLAFITALNPAGLVHASSIQLTISGNGSDSVSTIEQKEESKVEVEQSNDSQVVTEINVESNTGSNSASDNTNSQVNVETGAVETQVVVKNENINQNVVNLDCGECAGGGSDTTIKITDNGSGSTNTATNSQSSNTQVVQNNVAVINTNIKLNANTGKNSASDNTSSKVTMTTGDIYSNTQVVNKNINQNKAEISAGNGGSFKLTIAGNGADSKNVVIINQTNNTVHIANNQTSIYQQIHEDFNTGGNILDNNTGALVALRTGSIRSIVGVFNTGINSNNTTISCPDCVPDPDDPGDDDDDDNNGGGDDNGNGGDNGNGNGGDNGNGKGGSSNGDNGIGGANGQVLGAILPATGGASLGFALVNLGMFLSGLWLKLRRRLGEIFNTQYQFRVIITT